MDTGGGFLDHNPFHPMFEPTRGEIDKIFFHIRFTHLSLHLLEKKHPATTGFQRNYPIQNYHYKYHYLDHFHGLLYFDDPK